MRARPLLLLFALFFVSVSAFAQTTIWIGSTDSTPSSFGNSNNWVGGVVPDSTTIAVFQPPSQPRVAIPASTTVKGLQFKNTPEFQYPSYVLMEDSEATNVTLAIGDGSIVVDGLPTPSSWITLDGSLDVLLAANQTWNIGNNARLIVDSPVSGVGRSIAKTGAGTLLLNSATSNFSGGVTVQAGALFLGQSATTGPLGGPIGSGTLAMASGTTLGSSHRDVDKIVLHNAVSLGNEITFTSKEGDDMGPIDMIGGMDDDGGEDSRLELAGTLTLNAPTTTIHLNSDGPVWQTGLLTNSATNLSTTLTLRFDGTGGEFDGDFGGWVFGGTLDSGKTWNVEVDKTAVYFTNGSSGLPNSLIVTNGGYAGIGAVGTTLNITAAGLQSKIANPSFFAGTFGFDTDAAPSALYGVVPKTFSENLDFGAYTHSSNPSDPATRSFTIGSMSSAVLTGTITPPDYGSTSQYRFGGGGGVLVVDSVLDDKTDPASVVVTTPGGREPQTVVFRGDNSYSGTTLVDGVSANLAVERSIVVLDSATALPPVSVELPSGATFAFDQNAPAYVGATEEAFSDANFANFKARLAAGGYSSQSILGLDSHDFFAKKIQFGEDYSTYTPRSVGVAIDLSDLSPIYLGTASDINISGPISAPAGGQLLLTTVFDGRMEITSPFGGNVSSVVLGIASPDSEEFGRGTIRLGAANTYSGGTTLRNGTLRLAASSSGSAGSVTSGPVGTGTITVSSGSNGRPQIAPFGGARTLHNNIALDNSGLVIGDRDTADLLTLSGIISGVGSLIFEANAYLDNANTFSGEAWVVGSSLQVQNNLSLQSAELGLQSFLDGATETSTPASVQFTTNAPVIAGLQGFSSDATVSLGSTATLTVNTPLNAFSSYEGQINGNDGSKLTKSGQGVLRLAGTSDYSGGTTINQGMLIAANPNALGTGPITVQGGGLGVEHTTLTFAGARTLAFTSGVLAGSGRMTFSAVSLSIGASQGLAPGDKRSGALEFEFDAGESLTFDSEGSYYWELQDARPLGAGGSWDNIRVVNGSVDIAAAAGSPFYIVISSVDASGMSGSATNFSPALAYSWTILTAQGGITGFDDAKIAPIVGSFSNPLEGGTFSLSLSGDNTSLFLNFTPVPEPSTWALLMTGLAIVGVGAFRRRRRA